MILHSAIVTFAACGLLWTADVSLDGVFELSLDRPPPDEFKVAFLSCADGRRRPVHPRYQAPLLSGVHTRSLIRSAAAEALLAGFVKLTQGPTGEALADPELQESPSEALNRWLPMNAPQAPS